MDLMNPFERDQQQADDQWQTVIQKWWKAFVRVAWIASSLFFAQNAVASRLENEPRAALLYWMITAVVLLSGGIISLNRRINVE